MLLVIGAAAIVIAIVVVLGMCVSSGRADEADRRERLRDAAWERARMDPERVL